LICAADIDGFAMKNRLMEMERPALLPPAQVVPEEFRFTAGANTS
jgi:hypothetical protein